MAQTDNLKREVRPYPDENGKGKLYIVSGEHGAVTLIVKDPENYDKTGCEQEVKAHLDLALSYATSGKEPCEYLPRGICCPFIINSPHYRGNDEDTFEALWWAYYKFVFNNESNDVVDSEEDEYWDNLKREGGE